MGRFKILSVFGTRPEAVKMCPLVLEMRNRDDIESVVCVTGQHREMLDRVLEQFGVTADYDLKIMEEGQSLSEVTARILSAFPDVLAKEKPDLVLVHGDTATALSSALAAFYQKIPVGHVEAGLRTYDPCYPFPEEMNRRLIDRIAVLHFAPTEGNAENLRREMIQGTVSVTGNTVIDALKLTVQPDYQYENETLRTLMQRGTGEDPNNGNSGNPDNGTDEASGNKPEEKLILVTAHRRENLGEPLQQIISAVERIAADHPDRILIWPVHPNPRVAGPVRESLQGKGNIFLTEPLSTFDMHNLMASATLILTDSGGLQEEGPSFGVPVLVLRDETERPEAVAAGCVKVVGTTTERIVSETERLLSDEQAYRAMARAVNPYGDGHACRRIADEILRYLNAPGDRNAR